MADEKKKLGDSTDGRLGDSAKGEESGTTESGQEARRGVPPGEHDTEHQSQYGGGGTHGGAGEKK